VCRQMRSMIADKLPVRVVSVNLSRVHLRESGLLPKLEEIIRAHDIDPAMLSFEITESALYEDAIPLRSIVEHLHSLGCRVAMDDYGVGVSGPKSLTSYRFDTVKLDKSFVDDLYNPKVADLVRSTSYLVKKWGMRVVAEGVETKEQARKLVGLGCVYAQGFYYAKPMPEQEYRALLRDSVDSYGIEERQIRLQPQFFSDDVCAVFDSNPLPVYIIDPRSFTVVYCNLALQNALGEDVTGGVCYKKLNGKEHVCRNCVAMRLYRDGDGSPIEYMSRTGVWRRVQASPLHWRGQDYIRVSSMDITRQKRLEEQIRSLAEGEQQA
ncbi:MAG: EAL domain-containing protein, partial [Eubacteriales bacterium]|nr:EAL domain-containing protein [Eubacteriales bacterium]